MTRVSLTHCSARGETFAFVVVGSGGGSIGPTFTWAYVAAYHALASVNAAPAQASVSRLSLSTLRAARH
jgi:predicted glycosyltransferase